MAGLQLHSPPTALAAWAQEGQLQTAPSIAKDNSPPTVVSQLSQVSTLTTVADILALLNVTSEALPCCRASSCSCFLPPAFLHSMPACSSLCNNLPARPPLPAALETPYLNISVFAPTNDAFSVGGSTNDP